MKKRILSCLMALALCLTLLPATAQAEDGHTHCICGQTPHVGIGDHTVASQITFDKWLTSGYGIGNALTLYYDEADNISGHSVDQEDGNWLLNGGNYYLRTDVENYKDFSVVKINHTIVIKDNVTICLNGQTLESIGENMPVFRVKAGGTLTLTDCQGNPGKVKHTGDGSGSGVEVESGGTFNMYGGKITGNTAAKGGGVEVDSGKFNLYGGEIADNKSEGQNGTGGGVYVVGDTFAKSKGTFTMSGGTISGNTADSTDGADGGVGVYNDAEFTMSGGTISGNTAKGQGGGVGVHSRGTFTMNGGTIGGTTDGDANKAAKGGGVYVGNNGKFEMNGTQTSVSGNTATNGGGVYVYSGTFNMNDGTIGGATEAAANTATNNGGGVYVEGGKFEMNGPKTSVSGNTAATNGGGVYVERGTFTMNDGTIGGESKAAANTANQDGGGVCASGGTFAMNGNSKVTNNNGFGVFVNGGIFTVSGTPTVTENKDANDAASNVCLAGGAYITIGKFDSNGNANSIGVTKKKGVDNGVIAKNVSTDCSGKFFSDDKTREVKHENNQLVLKNKETQPSAHTHKWKYELSDDHKTITATCTGEGVCEYKTKPATVEISMTTTTYPYSENMKAPTAKLTYSNNWPSEVKKAQESDITYWEYVNGNCSVMSGAPKNIGKYKAEITVGGKTASVEYEIIAGTTEKIPVTKITLSPASPVLTVGQTQAMTVVIEPRTATDQNLTWKSSDNSVATVENGTVTAKAPGTAEITATAVDGSGKSATCKVTVTDGTTPSQPGGGTTGGGTTGGGTTGGTTGGSTGGTTGGGSSSDRDSSDSNPVVKTETKNNADGSTTKTETRKDGSVTQTTTGKDGSTSKTETKKDGSSVTENKAADGSTGTVKTDKHGQTTAETTLSSKAIEDAKKNGEAVKAPVEVEASRNSSTAPTVKVELPKGAGETKVEIPVSNVKPGTVAVLVHPDGTEEIVKNSIPTEDGIQLTVNGGATVKIVDNSKDFIDTRNHWAEDAIDFVSARGLVNGMTATIYAPNASTTRAQLWTILARQNDANLNGGSIWYEKAQNWAKDKGVSDGANPNTAINRAQMVTMLWRAVGQPAAGGTANFTDVSADAYYAGAVSWAVENGITTGVGGGRFDPTGACTRAQIAAFLARLYTEK